MGRPKKYVCSPGDIIGRGWSFVREGRGGSGYRYVWALCPACKTEVERPIGAIVRADRPEKMLMSCGCILAEWRSRKFRRREPREAALHEMIGRYKKNAPQRGHSYELTNEEAEKILFGNCFYCGAPPGLIAYARSYSARGILMSGIDRVDSAIGYIAGNVVSCCKTCNLMKNTLDATEFLQRCQRIASRAGVIEPQLASLSDSSHH